MPYWIGPDPSRDDQRLHPLERVGWKDFGDDCSGCLHTTSADFANLMLMLVKNGTLNGARILAPESIKLMITPTGFRNLGGWKQGLGFNGPEDL